MHHARRHRVQVVAEAFEAMMRKVEVGMNGRDEKEKV